MNVTLPARQKLSAAVLLVAGASLLAGCGSSSSSGGGSTTTSTTNPPASGTTGSSGGGKMVNVTLEDFKIIVAGGNSLKPGTYTFHVTNKGPSNHNLTINGPGVANQATPTFPSGSPQNLTVTLKNGTYAFYCSVPGHRNLGMDVSVKVGTGGGSSSGGGTTSGSGGTSSSGGGWA